MTPGKGGSTHLDVPVFNSVAEATSEVEIDVSMIFVPAKFAADAMKSAIESEIGLIVCITEGVPVQDMIEVKAMLKGSDSILLGPNCPGIITPEETKDWNHAWFHTSKRFYRNYFQIWHPDL